MRKKNSKLLFLIVSLLILIIVLGFSGSLYVSFFNNNYVKSVIASHSVAGGEAVRKIEYAMRYGKPLTNFYGIEKMLTEIKQGSPMVVNVRIILPDGAVLYDINGIVEEQHIGSKLAHSADFHVTEEGEKYRIITGDSKYEVFLPIKDRQGWVGNLNITFDGNSITAQTTEYLHQTVQTIVIIALLAALCFIFVIYAVPLVSANGDLMTRRLIVLVLVVLSLAQVISGLYNILLFKNFYAEVARHNTAVTAKIIQKNVESIGSKGVDYRELYHIEDWLNQIIAAVPEIDSVYIKNSSTGVLYGTSRGNSSNEAVSQVAMPPEYAYEVPLLTDSTGQEYSLAVVLSSQYLESKIKLVALDALTLLLVSLFFMVEIALFLVWVLQRNVNNNGMQDQGTDFLIIRPLAYVFLISWGMSVSFIPVMMLDFDQPLLGLSKGVILGLPLSVEAFTSILSTMITGYLIDRQGWKPSFIYGLIIFGAGTLLSAFSWSEITFILSRGMTGIGYGFSWMSLRGLAAMAPSGEGRATAFAGLNAGIYAGINCGVVLGAMLTERVGFSKVFQISAVLVFVTGMLTYLFAKNVITCNSSGAVKAKETIKDTWDQLKAFGQDRYIVAFFLLVAIPSSICLMFLNYFIPIFAKSTHILSTAVGWAFLLYGLCIVYLGPFFAKFIGRKISLKKATVWSNIICITGLLIFSVIGSYAAAMLGVLLLGISSSIGLVARNNYLLSLDSVKRLGTGTTLSLYSVVSKLGQVIGPIIFGACTAFGMASGVGLVGVLLFILLGVFIFVTRNEGKGEQPKAGIKI
ncbi:MAG: Major Facilitator Superfamily Protein [Firmicutes bacterium]|nr:Major Facilitator Superfamily Protein [Bacillota bacterium]